MRLEELDVIPYSLPFREPYVTARGELHERRLILVRLRGEGFEGLGETTALSLRGGIGIDAIAAEIRERQRPFEAAYTFRPEGTMNGLCLRRGAKA